MSSEPDAEFTAAQPPSHVGGAEPPRPALTGRRSVTLEDGRYLIYYTFEESEPARSTQ